MKKISIFIICGPSGVGKSSIISEILKSKKKYTFIKSYTTRKKRNNQDSEYHFISHDDFLERVNNNFFVEHNQVFDNYYGLSKESIETSTIKIINMDIEGSIKLRKLYRAIVILIVPPSINELHNRIISRDGELCKKRAARIKRELSHASDYTVVNSEIEQAAREVIDIIESYL